MRRLRIYLAYYDGVELKTEVCPDLERVLQKWSEVRETFPEACGLLHVGFGKPNDDALLSAVNEKPRGCVLATGSARWSLPRSFEFAEAPIASIQETEESPSLPLYVGLTNWGYSAAAIPEAIVGGIKRSPEVVVSSDPLGWLSELQRDDPVLYQELARTGVYSDDLYMKARATLPEKIRDTADDARFSYLRDGLDTADPDAILRAAPQWLLDADVTTLPLTVRIWNVLRNVGISRPSQLIGKGREWLLERKNFGRKSIEDLTKGLLRAIEDGRTSRDAMASVEPARSLREELDRTMSGWVPQRRKVFESRIGLGCNPQTLEEIARSVGLTRERVRQIEKATIREIVEGCYWDDILVAKIERHLATRREPLYLDLLQAEDPWFGGFETEGEALGGLISCLSGGRLKVLDVDGRPVVTLSMENSWEGLIERIAESLGIGVERRWSRREVHLWIEAQLRAIGASELVHVVVDRLAPRLHFAQSGESEAHVLVGLGRGLKHHIQAILEESATPLHFREIAERVATRMGRTDNADFEGSIHRALLHSGALLFGRGRYGTPEHVPFGRDQQQDILAELEDIVLGDPGNRQWHSKELVDQLYERRPDLLQNVDAYLVGVILQTSTAVERLGRMVWTRRKSVEGGPTKRIEVAELVVKILRDSVGPMTTIEIRSAVEATRESVASSCFSRVETSPALLPVAGGSSIAISA